MYSIGSNPQTRVSVFDRDYGLGMSLPEWQAADNLTRATAFALYQENGYRESFAREAAASAESGINLGGAGGTSAIRSAWSQR